MKPLSPTPPPESDDRSALVTAFVGANSPYYEGAFTRISDKSGVLIWTFNYAAALLGPIWYGMRGLWRWGLPFAILEAFALIQFARGMWGNLATDLHERIAQIESTLQLRQNQLEAAIANNADNVDVFKRTIASLESAIGEIYQEVQQVEAAGIWWWAAIISTSQKQVSAATLESSKHDP
ncbi:hypothetical protein C2W62_31980 [Candidatus Entotheonella serta]|nr:hypothetical protein C2W62_31980 [Candidatus Entotheonella serta]